MFFAGAKMVFVLHLLPIKISDLYLSSNSRPFRSFFVFSTILAGFLFGSCYVCPLNLQLVWSRKERYMPSRKNLARVRTEPGSCDHGPHKHNASTFSAALPMLYHVITWLADCHFVSWCQMQNEKYLFHKWHFLFVRAFYGFYAHDRTFCKHLHILQWGFK